MDKMAEICRRIASAINSLLGLLGSVFLLGLLLALLWYNNDIECWLKGAEYMAARGVVCH
jgi:hypothetical protein